MNKPADIKEIIETLDIMSTEHYGCHDRETGEIHLFDHSDNDLDTLQSLESPDELPEWQMDIYETAKLIENDTAGRFVELPTSYDLNDWKIMEAFALDLGKTKARESLLDALHGRGAYRRFKDQVLNLGIEEKWYQYKDEKYRQIVIEWCKENNLEWR